MRVTIYYCCNRRNQFCVYAQRNIEFKEHDTVECQQRCYMCVRHDTRLIDAHRIRGICPLPYEKCVIECQNSEKLSTNSSFPTEGTQSVGMFFRELLAWLLHSRVRQKIKKINEMCMCLCVYERVWWARRTCSRSSICLPHSRDDMCMHLSQNVTQFLDSTIFSWQCDTCIANKMPQYSGGKYQY